mmetsp:Transcript_2209/g.3413  ORF Transcript_2209/g.3413 Transcript_2209/m.3413 type:complete len:239 (-) Transcript_2209:185-901(-)
MPPGSWNQPSTAAHNVGSTHEHLDDRSIGGWPPYPFLLEGLHQGTVTELWWRRRVMLQWPVIGGLAPRLWLELGHRFQQLCILPVSLLPLLEQSLVAWENDRAHAASQEHASFVIPKVKGQCFDSCISHLTCHAGGPDQIVQLQCLRIHFLGERGWRQPHVGGPYGLVRFLGILASTSVHSWGFRQIVLPKLILYEGSRTVQKRRREIRPVCSHVRDQAFAITAVISFVQFLSEQHCL